MLTFRRRSEDQVGSIWISIEDLRFEGNHSIFQDYWLLALDEEDNYIISDNRGLLHFDVDSRHRNHIRFNIVEVCQSVSQRRQGAFPMVGPKKVHYFT